MVHRSVPRLRIRRPGRASALALTAMLLVAACADTSAPSAMRSDAIESTLPGAPTTVPAGGTTSTPAPAPTTDAPTVGVPMPDSSAAFGWKPYKGSKTGPGEVEVGSITVPIDYNDPAKGTFTLPIARHRANDPAKRVGSLLVDPGGPGFGASILAIQADQIYSQTLLDSFDIVGWDLRGTGSSKPAIDCVDDYDRYYASTDITPDTPEQRQQIIDLSKEFEQACIDKNSTILEYVGTNNVARDMNEIRKGLGEAKITYFGWSYGSELGGAWATLFPSTVRAAVLDGAADPTADFVTTGLEQSKGVEASLDNFLSQCSAETACKFHNDGNAEGAYDALMQQLDDQPIDSVKGRPKVNLGVAITGVAEAMYSDQLWPELEQALADAQAGKGKGLLDLYDSYLQRQPDGSYDNSLEAFQVISCMDNPVRLTVEEEDSLAAEFSKAAPRIAPNTTGTYFCTFLPPSIDPRVTITGKGAGPILVVGTTGDGITPLASSQKMADALEGGVLLTVVGNQHTGYGVNKCSFDTIDAYLVSLTVPAAGTRCE